MLRCVFCSLGCVSECSSDAHYIRWVFVHSDRALLLHASASKKTVMGSLDAGGYVWLSYYSISGHLCLWTNLSYKYPGVYYLSQSAIVIAYQLVKFIAPWGFSTYNLQLTSYSGFKLKIIMLVTTKNNFHLFLVMFKKSRNLGYV